MTMLLATSHCSIVDGNLRQFRRDNRLVGLGLTSGKAHEVSTVPCGISASVVSVVVVAWPLSLSSPALDMAGTFWVIDLQVALTRRCVSSLEKYSDEISHTSAYQQIDITLQVCGPINRLSSHSLDAPCSTEDVYQMRLKEF